MNNTKPDCYKCEYRWSIPGDAHSTCKHPVYKDISPEVKLLGLLGAKINVPGLNIQGHPDGIKNGWFNHPFNFDPIWLIACNGFKQEEV
jgi:hypothetical protein